MKICGDGMANSADLYDRLYSSFIANAREWIIELESGLLKLEKSPEDKELINNIFRIAHNIKSTSGTAGFNEIYRFTHKIEDILYLIRQGSLVPDRNLIDMLLQGVDLVEEMIETAALKEHFDFHRCKDWMKKMGDKNGGL